MKKVLISRYGAYGDVLHCSHLPRLLKEKGYDYVAFETNTKGYQVLAENPYIDELIHFDPQTSALKNAPISALWKHWAVISQDYDKFINLFRTLEYKHIVMEDMNEFYMNDKFRREKYGINFFDAQTIEAGYPEEIGRRGEVHFSDEEINTVEQWIDRRNSKFNILLNLSGSSLQKRFIQAKDVVEKILKKYKDANIILTGDYCCKEFEFFGDNIESIAGVMPFRQAMCIAQYVDLVITYESGLGIASNIFETPTIQLMTTSSITNHANGAKNDLSLQSPIKCSPCHKGVYSYIGCPSKNGLPACVYFNVNEIMKKVDVAYEYYVSKFKF